MWYQELWAVRGMILKNISNQSKVRRKIKATKWLLIGVMPSVLFPILFPFFVLWCELHGLYLAVWISMVAWLNPIMENNICLLATTKLKWPIVLEAWLLAALLIEQPDENKNAVLIVNFYRVSALSDAPPFSDQWWCECVVSGGCKEPV